MPGDSSTRLHGTCICISGEGILLRGPSGSGKSDLTLRLIDGGAVLVADDCVVTTARDGTLTASAPREVAGLLEVRGIGIVEVPWVAYVRLGGIVDLVAREAVERLPERTVEFVSGVMLPVWRLHGFDASTPAKLRLIAQEVKARTTESGDQVRHDNRHR